MPSGSVVMKFGGSCLRSTDGIRKIVAITSREKRVALVVSALAGVTDSIVREITGRLSEKSIEAFTKQLAARHLQTLGVFCSGEMLERYSDDVRKTVAGFSRILYGVYYTGELTQRMKALLMSFGERLSARVIAGALESSGMRVRVFDADTLPLLTDNNYGNGNALLPLTKKMAHDKLNAAVEEGTIPVVTGFFGTNREGHVTLLGRNGTDYSASIVAYAMGASRLVIWKDVDGFLTADPSYVGRAKLIAELSYDEASELSYFGANVLHPKAVEPAEEGNIRISIRNIEGPSQGTLVTSSRKKAVGVVKSVSCLKNLSIVRVYVSGGGFQAGAISEISGFLGRAGVNIMSATTSQTCIAFLVLSSDLPTAVSALRESMNRGIEKIESERRVALMCVVGEGLGTTKGIAARVFTAISACGVNVGMMSAGASRAAYHFTVKMEDLDRAMNAVHDVFFGD